MRGIPVRIGLQRTHPAVSICAPSVGIAFVGRGRVLAVADGGGSGTGGGTPGAKVVWSAEEKALLRKALVTVQQEVKGTGVAYTYKAVFNKFVETSGGQTSRRYLGTRLQIKALVGASPVDPVAGVLGPTDAPAVSMAQMMGEIMSTMPGMQATSYQGIQRLAKHPVYCNLLNWTPLKKPKRAVMTHSWHLMFDTAITSRKHFTVSQQLSVDFKHVYVFDPSRPNQFDDPWRGMPWVLASLLTTYLAQPGEPGQHPRAAVCTAEELTEVLLMHPMYGAVLKVNGGQLTVSRFLDRVEKALYGNIGTLFERVQAVKGKAPQYKAIICPRKADV